ncbi:MAG: hypothetical protein ACD_2C00137G0003 [uncultured bacterium (gcode 4)]|uniref:Methyltransferase domain-containing protein n=1 Tax=uncultured bacterium (gcode 4) TaxID=1234023 RepID=K2G341_9BACT|nr:MAG: hypothetical protein ACD_2C00137G0003 [uncultured bacterium (gcode 4)]
MVTLIFSGLVLLLYLAGFCYLAFYFWREMKQVFSSYWVPFVPTSDNKLALLLESLRLDPGQTFIDIGCWDGKILQAIEEKFPGVRVKWFEKSGYPYSLAIKRKERTWCKYEVLKADFFKCDIQDADVVYSYVLPYLMKKIWKKMTLECKIWTMPYSNSFRIPGIRPKKLFKFENDQDIYVYVVGK